MTRFALIGAAGYIAPRHLKAIKEVGGDLVAALDPFDAVGILDGYFPGAQFFREPEVFEAYLEDNPVDWVSVVSPNHLHEAHIRLGLRQGAHVLCEKPLVVEPESLDRLAAMEARTGKRVYTVLQLRVHPALLALRERLQGEKGKKEVVLTYITSRGPWYQKSWKADEAKSGGVATNIGIHFFDLLLWYFGGVEALEVHLRTPTTVAGFLELERARVRWFLSIDAAFLPKEVVARGQRTYRSIAIEGQEVEFSEGFTDLHTEVYRRTLAGEGFGLEEARPGIELTARVRRAEVVASRPEVRHAYLG
ncbi:Gfo/Idh/MocA family oxidoreductase [Thermus sp. SYSU G05001]|uniref:Gfo/Idh/MocA family oxidoreductase n=1 Tax=Thermus brevis TaxID=2862456 RepID=A0ABS6ZWX0_9DEIN|nr:Gfo/Idh/MocA family oxidoreductase [Thermus brevis]MBW6394554.1 Gfo/Idh/MocA family oxidoreductase [Thermus brevis]